MPSWSDELPDKTSLHACSAVHYQHLAAIDWAQWKFAWGLHYVQSELWVCLAHWQNCD